MTLYRVARLLAVAIVAGIGIATIIWAVTDLHFNDLDSYRLAALRIRDGEQLYGGDVGPFNKYYYAPWFAFAFVPLSYLPWELLAIGWSVFTVGCSLIAVWPLVRHGTVEAWVAAGIFGPTLVALSLSGNIHAPMLAMLVLLLRTRWGPVAIGVAASLKATPILLVIAYVGRREWGRASLAIGVAALLWAPLLLFELAPITFESGGAALRLELWLALGAIGALSALLVTVRWPRFRWLASSVAVFLATPRLYVYDITILLAATAKARDDTSRSADRQRTGDWPRASSRRGNRQVVLGPDDERSRDEGGDNSMSGISR